MSHTITTWTLFSWHSGISQPKLTMNVLDEEYLTSARFGLFGAGWSKDTQKMAHVPAGLTNRLNALVRAHPVLGAQQVLEYLDLTDKPEPAPRTDLDYGPMRRS